MASSLNRETLKTDNIMNVISNDKFSDFTPEMQESILKKIENQNRSDGGFMGKFFGNKKELASMNTAFVICVLLLLVGVFVNDLQFWSGILPVVGAAIGYIFGKGGKTE